MLLSDPLSSNFKHSLVVVFPPRLQPLWPFLSVHLESEHSSKHQPAKAGNTGRPSCTFSRSQSDIPSNSQAEADREPQRPSQKWITHISVYISTRHFCCYRSPVLPIRSLPLNLHTCLLNRLVKAWISGRVACRFDAKWYCFVLVLSHKSSDDLSSEKTNIHALLI